MPTYATSSNPLRVIPSMHFDLSFVDPFMKKIFEFACDSQDFQQTRLQVPFSIDISSLLRVVEGTGMVVISLLYNYIRHLPVDWWFNDVIAFIDGITLAMFCLHSYHTIDMDPSMVSSLMSTTLWLFVSPWFHRQPQWSRIATQLPPITYNKVENFWNNSLQKKLRQKGIDPNTHEPLTREIGEDPDENKFEFMSMKGDPRHLLVDYGLVYFYTGVATMIKENAIKKHFFDPFIMFEIQQEGYEPI
ncbi:hypothetical protein Sjap_005231 [Stephania japonica]|uniref:Uncharacterized protein n=1 Tax=Stephania japonica TaxID=461633 RepID=A0AAP0PHP1_9MAGN